ncbi:MAG: SDR family NAD(P)-dependent oxidoreductase [Bdellovibrionales bacterium]|nr:SDR family NAD(P)-dependent oxidoreductase [Bdellovibrionales bacterium]
MKSNERLSEYVGSWALVTGASSGIGAEFCRQLSCHGVNLVLVARRTNQMNLLAAELQKKAQIQTLVIPLDLSSPGSAASLISTVESRGIKIRMLINNAAYGPWGPFERIDLPDAERLVQLLIGTPTALIRGFLDHLSSFPTAAIINLSSQAALQPIPYLATYAACKSGLHQLSLALYEEFRSRGIYVQTLIPGPTQTEIDQVGEAYKSGVSEKRDPPEKIVSLSLNAIPSRRPIISGAPNIFFQKAFSALFPTTFVLNKIGQLFQPPSLASKKS